MSAAQMTTYYVRHQLVINQGLSEREARGLVRKHRDFILRRLSVFGHPSVVATEVRLRDHVGAAC